ncbi:unnamed protein product [Caretta caretta]
MYFSVNSWILDLSEKNSMQQSVLEPEATDCSIKDMRVWGMEKREEEGEGILSKKEQRSVSVRECASG